MIGEEDNELEDYGEVFNPPTPERVQVSIEKVLKAKTGIRKVKPTPADKKRDEFCSLITRIEHAATRGIYASEFIPSMEDWDDAWLEIIEDLLSKQYSASQISLINFYLWDRYDENGQVKELEFEGGNGQVVYLDTPEQLYYIIGKIK